MKFCKNGLHAKDYPGYCKACKREKDRRWIVSEKGRKQRAAANHKWYYETMSGLQYQGYLLKNRRRSALWRRERRNSGALPDEG